MDAAERLRLLCAESLPEGILSVDVTRRLIRVPPKTSFEFSRWRRRLRRSRKQARLAFETVAFLALTVFSADLVACPAE